MAAEPVRLMYVDYRCQCGLCRRHRRAAYIIRLLRRIDEEGQANFLIAMFDHLLDVEGELELINKWEEDGH